MKKRVQRPTAPERPAKPKLGRPVTRWIKLDATPEEAAQAMFAPAKAKNPPDPKRRIYNRPDEDEQ